MQRKLLFILILMGSVVAARDATGVLDDASRAMGNPASIQFSGSGAAFNFGQNIVPTKAWPRAELRSFSRTIDYDKTALRTESAGPQGPGAVQFLSGGKAWGQAANGNITPAAPAAVAERQLQIWLTPHGFIRAARANNATAKSGKSDGRKVTVVSFNQGKQRFTGTISADHLVEKVESWIDNPVLGDMRVEMAYSDYRDFSGVKFPTKITQRQGGFPVLELTVASVQNNVPLTLAVPDAVQQATPPPVTVASEKLADGVWYLTGGSHHSVAVEFGDNIAVIEAPLGEERSSAVIAEVKKLIPNKPIRYLINTHHHFDHSGGLRTYVAEGATIVTHQANQAFYQNTAKAPHKLNPDRLEREKRKLKLIGVGDRYVLTDGKRVVEIHHIRDNPHHEGILMAYLPQEKLLVEVDVYNPLAANAPPPSTPNAASVNLYDNIRRLNLDVERIAALHGRMVTLADLRKAIGQ